MDAIFILQPLCTTFVLSFCVAKVSRHRFPFFLNGRYHLCALTRPHSAAPLSPEGVLLHTSGAPVFAVAAQECSLIAWLWWPRRLVFLDPMVLYNRIQFLAKYYPQGSAHIAEWNTPLVFLRKWPICLSKKFGLRGRFLVWHSSRCPQTCFQENRGHWIQSLRSALL